MKQSLPVLEISPAPYVRAEASTSRLMREVLLATLPPLAVATWLFGLSALLVVGAAVSGAALAEYLAEGRNTKTLMDSSALLTGVLLGLTLPPAIPMWVAFLGGLVAVVLGKSIWGGLGRNLFNPALVGRAFLQAAFPSSMTTWTAPSGSWSSVLPSTLTAPFLKPAADVLSTATPLGMAKFEHRYADIQHIFMGNTAGSLGETSAALLIAIGVFLAFRRAFDWRLPVATVSTVALFSGLLYLIKPDLYPTPMYMVFSGGLIFGSVFMVTDPVTTPITPRGAWIFGAGVGALVVLIRLFGGLPEAVMYSILLMNSVTPLINRMAQPRRFGG